MSNDCQNIKMSLIKPAWNMLRPVRETEIEWLELVDSVREHGVLQSILVRDHPTIPGHYEVIDGSWRYFSVKSLDIPEIPCIIKVGIETDEQYLAMQIECNALSYATKPIEFAEQLQKIIDLYESSGTTLSLAQLGSFVKKSATWVSSRLSLLKLCDKAKEQVRNGTLTIGKAVALSRINSHEHQERFLKIQKDMRKIDFEFEIGKFIAEARATAISERAKERNRVELRARLQSMDDTMIEMDRLEHVSQLILQRGATTAIEGAKIALEWVLNLHPEGRDKQVKEIRHKLSQTERREIIGRRRYDELEELRKLKEQRDKETRKSFGEEHE